MNLVVPDVKVHVVGKVTKARSMPKAKQKSANRIRPSKAQRERSKHVPPEVGGGGVSAVPFGQSFRPRRLETQNIVPRLFHREINGSRHKKHFLNTTRGFYTNIYPNYTLINLEKPPCFLRKFTPDGKRFIAFSADQGCCSKFIAVNWFMSYVVREF